MKWKHIIVTILIISGRSCFLLRRNTSSMISTPLPWTTRTLMQSISFHSWSSIVQCVTLSNIKLPCLERLPFCATWKHSKLNTRPMVMLVGQYSTGKTTFIRYLLEQVRLANKTCLLKWNINNHTLGLPWHQNRTGANHRQVKHHHCFGHSRPPIIP